MYQIFYTILLVPLLSTIAFLPLGKPCGFRTIIALFLSCGTVLTLLVLRDVYAPADIWSYIQIYNGVSGINSVINAYQNDYTFAVFLYVGKLFGLQTETFYISLTIVNVGLLFIGLKYLFQRQKYVIFCFTLFVLTSTFVLMFTNAIRQGLAIVLFILSISLYARSNRVGSYFILLSAAFSHLTMIPFAGFFVIRAFLVNKKMHYKLILIFIPFLTLFGYAFLDILAQNFDKMQASITYNDLAYGKSATYVKALLLYIFGIIFYIFGSKYNNFSIFEYKLIFDIYLFGLAMLFATLPVLFIASRFLYYPSALMPILLTYVFFSRRSILMIEPRAAVYFIGMLMYGTFVYNFPSIQAQLID